MSSENIEQINKKIFISYSYQDRDFVEWLKPILTGLGFEIWYNQQEINVCDNIKEKINEGIQSSSVVIFVLSSSSMNSDWVRYEMNSALFLNVVKKGITILPIKIDNSKMPSDLSGYLYADFSVNKEQGLNILKRSLLKSNIKLDYEFADWSYFDGKTYEDMIFDLLIYEGFRNVIRTPPIRDGGYDFIAITQNALGLSEKIVIESKFYKNHKISINILRKLYAITLTGNANKIFLITNSELTNASRDFLTHSMPNIVVWEGHELIKKLFSHPTLVEKYSSQKTFTKKEKPTDILDTELLNIQRLLKSLDNCPDGSVGWQIYEDICIEILNYLFVPPLGKPEIQSRRESGIDIRDAIFPNRTNNENWKFIRDDYDAKYIVFEFKNYSENGSEIDKQVLLQISDYLKRTIGRFGIVCSKKTPNKSGLEKRKDIFIENNKLILFLCNENLKEMLLRKYKKMDPSDVIIDLIDDFNFKF
jgi:HJR/Mrr/RecB family endonuclease